MTITVKFSAGTSFLDACRQAQELMKLVPVVSIVEFKANEIQCTVYPDTDPESFEQMVNYAQDHKKTHVIGTMAI